MPLWTCKDNGDNGPLSTVELNIMPINASFSGVLGVPNGSTMVPGEGRNKKLNSELANGRLAL